MRFARAAWEQERNGWRAVVQLNIVRSITTILRAIESEMRDGPVQESDEGTLEVDTGQHEELMFNEKHSLLMFRLTPLLAVEAMLKRRLGPGAESQQPELPMVATPFDEPTGRSVKPSSREFAVRSWKEVLHSDSQMDNTEEDLESATITITKCKDDMKALWNDKTVRLVLKRRGHGLSDSARLWVSLKSTVSSIHILFSFLNDLERIASRGYVVSDEDIVLARLRTVGIQEHRLYGRWGKSTLILSSGLLFLTLSSVLTKPMI